MAAKSKNITWQDSKVTEAERTKLYGHKGAVVWLTGLSGAGKSTIAFELEKSLLEKDIHAYILDGDNVRHGLNSDLGFSNEDRTENLRRVSEVAKLFADAGLIVITAFITPFESSRQFARSTIKEKYVEVFVDCPIEECEKRDPKGLYKKARSGEIQNFTGVSAPFEKPKKPEIHLHTDKHDAQACVQQIFDYLNKHHILH